MKVHLRMSAMSNSLHLKTVNFYELYTAKQQYHQTGEVSIKDYWNLTFWRDVTIRFSRQLLFMWWMFTSFSDLCWFSCPVDTYCIHLQGEWMGTGDSEMMASVLEVLRAYGQSQLPKGEEEIWLGPEPTGRTSYARGRTIKFSLHFPVHCYDWTYSFKPPYITDTFSSNPTLYIHLDQVSHPLCGGTSLPNIRNNNVYYALQNPKRQSL